MSAGVFELNDDADALVTASTAWAEASGVLGRVADDVTSGAQSTMGAGWEGETATSYDAHRKQLVSGIDKAADAAQSIATTMATTAGAVRAAQSQLDVEWSKVASVPHVSFLGLGLTFHPEDEAQAARVDAALAAATSIRTSLDATLRADVALLDAAKATWSTISSTWESVAAGDVPPFDVPDEQYATGVITDGDQTIVNTGAGDDEVKVFTDPFTGDTIVSVDGQLYRLPAGQTITIRTGGGDDVVEIGSGTKIDVTVIGGSGGDSVTGSGGDDTVIGLGGQDDVDAGDGDDYVSGGGDRDYVDGQGGDDDLYGGEGDDTVYGLDGDDNVNGGEGDDYLEGAQGDDQVVGGDGDDVVSGGDGDDDLYGGAGDDVVYAGRGDDTTQAGSGNDTSYGESGDDSDAENTVHVEIPDTDYFIKIEGSPEFQARVQADLDMLRSSPAGQQMLENLQQGHDDSGFLGLNKSSLTIREYVNPDDPNNSTASHSGNDYEINYNKRLDSLGIGDGSQVEGPPIAVLYHELAHVYDYANDTLADGDYHGEDGDNQGTPNKEREAAGLPIDHDNDPSTPEIIDPDHPYQYTENGLREELGVDHRDHY